MKEKLPNDHGEHLHLILSPESKMCEETYTSIRVDDFEYPLKVAESD
jgi:hypothetical protein